MKKILLMLFISLFIISTVAAWDYSRYNLRLQNTAIFIFEPAPTIFKGVCGNNKLEVGEQCDPIMQPLSPYCPDYAKFCTDQCRCQTLCGNGHLEPGEECDGGLYCNPATCRLEPQSILPIFTIN